MRDVKAMLDRPYVRHANTIVLAGIGTNDLCRRSATEIAPPQVVGLSAAKPRFQLDLSGGESVTDQEPWHGAEDVSDFLKEIASRLTPNQILLTFDPFPRRTDGFCNRQIGLLNSKLVSLSPSHHHVKSINAFTASNWSRKKKSGPHQDVFGGRRPTQDLFFLPGNIHLKGHALEIFKRAVISALYVMRDVCLGGEMPKKGTKVVIEKGFTWKF